MSSAGDAEEISRMREPERAPLRYLQAQSCRRLDEVVRYPHRAKDHFTQSLQFGYP